MGAVCPKAIAEMLLVRAFLICYGLLAFAKRLDVFDCATAMRYCRSIPFP